MANKGHVRIIGGKWRGRILHFPSHKTLRPTTDRVRETLFNWLMHDIHGANCLDLFAGSGAIGFEALSRGAKTVTFVDESAEVIQYLKKQAQEFQTEDIEMIRARVPSNKIQFKTTFDIVFLDPPFKENLVQECCEWLESLNVLSEQALIYIEMAAQQGEFPVPQFWTCLNVQQAGNVRYALFLRQK